MSLTTTESQEQGQQTLQHLRLVFPLPALGHQVLAQLARQATKSPFTANKVKTVHVYFESSMGGVGFVSLIGLCGPFKSFSADTREEARVRWVCEVAVVCEKQLTVGDVMNVFQAD